MEDFLKNAMRYCSDLNKDKTCKCKINNEWTCKTHPILCCAMCSDCENKEKCDPKSFCSVLW